MFNRHYKQADLITGKYQMKKTVWAPWLMFLSAMVFQIIALDPAINIYDEGIVLVGAEMISSGQKPYQDFWTMYGPAQFYLTSWLFDIFGHVDIVVRAMGNLEKSLIVSLAYSIMSRFVSKICSIVASIVILCMLAFAQNDAFPVFPALSLAMVSVVLAEKGFSTQTGYLFLSGLSTGLTASFRHDLGFYCAIAISASALIINFTPNKNHAIASPLKKTTFQILTYSAGVLMVFAPVLGFLLYSIPPADLYENLLHIPSKIYPTVRSLPFPKIHLGFTADDATLAVYVPFLTAALVVFSEIYTMLGGKLKRIESSRIDGTSYIFPVIFIVCVLFIIKGIVRVSFLHMVQAISFSIIAQVIYSTRIDWKSKAAKFVLVPAFMLSMCLALIPAFFGAKEFVLGAKSIINGSSKLLASCMTPSLPRIRCNTVDNNYLLAAKIVMEKTQPHDKIYFAAGRHDKLFANAVAFYFFAERLPATKWYDLHPGVQTQERIQLEMIEEMRKDIPKIILVDSTFDGADEPNNSRLAIGSKMLDSFIHENYVETHKFGAVQIMELR